MERQELSVRAGDKTRPPRLFIGHYEVGSLAEVKEVIRTYEAGYVATIYAEDLVAAPIRATAVSPRA